MYRKEGFYGDAFLTVFYYFSLLLDSHNAAAGKVRFDFEKSGRFMNLRRLGLQ